jgi:hypothetical protein
LHRTYHRHQIDLNGAIISTTVTKPQTGISKLEGLLISDILPPSDAKKYINALFLAVTKDLPQWCDYAIYDKNYITLIDYLKNDVLFVIHEAPYEVNRLQNTKKLLLAALKNYRKKIKE